MTDRRGLALAGAVVVIAHNLEEALVTPVWLRAHPGALARLFGFMGRPVPQLHEGVMYMTLALVTALSVAWGMAGTRSAPGGPLAHSLLALFAMYAGNAVVPHIAAALLLGGYVPGLFTAALVVLPYVCLYSVVGIREGWFTGRGAAASLAAGILLYAALGLGLQGLLAGSM